MSDQKNLTVEEQQVIHNLRCVAVRQIQQPTVIGTEIYNGIQKLNKHIKGIDGIIDTVKGGTTENTEQQLRNALSAVRDCAKATTVLGEILLSYVASGDMETTAQKAAIKLGADSGAIFEHVLRRKIQGGN